ncbi:MAG TPA: CPBP family intramembrane metalloprotease [Fulvivirga sp.]|nr:CPBP family intramembrane metalloprotease [Fulvivirga sp.]
MIKSIKKLSKKGWQFVMLTVLLSSIPYFFIISEGNAGSDWTMLLMWMPALAGIIMRLSYKEGLFKGINWNPITHYKWILIAAFIPFTIEILSMALSVASGAALLKEGFITVHDGNISIKGMALLFGAASQPWYGFIPNFLLSYFVGALMYSLVFALGEEYGWRGYLQKEWVSSNKLFPFIVIGAIWGWWHLPSILLGHNYPDYPILGGFILMPILTTLFSVVFGLTYSKTKVIWVPVMFHGALNISTEISNAGLIEASINKPLNDFIWSGLWMVAAIVFWKNRKE